MSDIATTAESTARSSLAAEVSRRRTFAIISHPDAGKTTLTEKLLLFGGAINLAGQVKAKGERRNTRSDWMKIERERGISVVTSVMTFEFEGLVFNLLDTPGHEDFSEDTYRTLTAVDSAVMVIDAAKGIEARTRKLFEVCRLRDIPIITFINKMDRESRDVFELLDEIEKTLALDTTPMTWPVGRGREFLGTYDVVNGGVRLLEGGGAKTGAAQQIEIAELGKLNANLDVSAVKDELELVTAASKPFELEAFREGHLTPVYFGSALRNFGVGDLLQGLGKFAPEPRAQESDQRKVEATDPRMSAFVFKIQANMDPNHRDRIAFARLCSGKLSRGMKAKLVRTGKSMPLSSPQFFFAQDRSVADEAYAGDVVGIPNHGTLRIGDTLTDGEDFNFVGVPSFAPEIVRRVRLTDAMKAKKLKEALQQMSEEGVVQVFRPRDGAPALVGVVGALQLDVLKARLDAEYSLPVEFEVSEFQLARWVSSDDRKKLDTFIAANTSSIADDVDGDPVYLARNEFYLATPGNGPRASSSPTSRTSRRRGRGVPPHRGHARAGGASSTPQPLGSITIASGILDRPVEPDDDTACTREHVNACGLDGFSGDATFWSCGAASLFSSCWRSRRSPRTRGPGKSTPFRFRTSRAASSMEGPARRPIAARSSLVPAFPRSTIPTARTSSSRSKAYRQRRIAPNIKSRITISIRSAISSPSCALAGRRQRTMPARACRSPCASASTSRAA